MCKEPKVLIYDIETAPCLGWFWRTGKTNVGAHQIIRPGKIICISYRFQHWPEGKVKNLKWKRKKRDNRFSIPFTDEAMVKKFAKIAEEADVLVGHNGDNFDRKVINSRLAYYNHPGLGHHVTEDTLKQARLQFNLPSFRLDFLCKYFNIPGKLSTATGLWERVVFDGSSKDLNQMVEYCDQDVLILAALYDRLHPYVKHKLNRAAFGEEPDACPTCGSKGTLTKRGFTYTTVGKYQRYQCTECGSWCKGGQNLIRNSNMIRR